MYKWKGKITPQTDTLSLVSSLDLGANGTRSFGAVSPPRNWNGIQYIG